MCHRDVELPLEPDQLIVVLEDNMGEEIENQLNFSEREGAVLISSGVDEDLVDQEHKEGVGACLADGKGNEGVEWVEPAHLALIQELDGPDLQVVEKRLVRTLHVF